MRRREANLFYSGSAQTAYVRYTRIASCVPRTPTSLTMGIKPYNKVEDCITPRNQLHGSIR